MNDITFQYPAWYFLFCIILGLGYSLLLYYRDQTFREQSSKLNLLLGVLRFIAVTAISALLLAPLLRSAKTETKKPVVIIAQDESESVVADMDENARAGYQRQLEELQASLGDDYEIRPYSFGEEVKEGIDFQYNDKVTDISELLTEVYDLYSNQNLGAVVLATDGIYNQGSNPVYAGTRLNAPIFTVALGDTTPKRDLILKRAFHNQIAYLGDKFSVQLDITAKNSAGSNSTLQVFKVESGNTRKLQEMPVAIDRNDFFTTREVILDADQAGVQRYRISLSGIANEVSTANNVKDIFIDVLDARQKILILANSPHPDLSAIRQSLQENKNYQTEVAYISNFTKNPADYDMIVLHQLPSRYNTAAAVINAVTNQKIPVLYIVGGQTDLGRLNEVQPLLTIRPGGATSNEVQARVAPDFSLFNLDEDLNRNLLTFAPLTAPFGEFAASGVGQVFLYQRISRIDTPYPLLVLGEQNGNRVGVLAAEGIWKWRLFDFLQHQNHDIFNSLLSKTIQYISLKEDKRKFRVSLPENIFDENEQIVFDAELYNDSYELINEPEATLVVTDGEGKEYNYTFNKTSRSYTLNAGILPVQDPFWI